MSVKYIQVAIKILWQACVNLFVIILMFYFENEKLENM